jgi:N-succinyl-L-ornithine transcarbamylase
MKHFISPADVPNVQKLIQDGLEAKKNPFANQGLGKNKTIGLIFFNASLRTRLSTQKAAQNLGMNVMVMNVGQDSWLLEMEDGVMMDGSKAEHIKEAAAVIGSYCDIIAVRAFAELSDRAADYREIVMSKFMKYSGVPIVNLESATRHPLQSLADLITIEEHKKTAKPKVVLTWLPHFKALPQAVANSFCEWVNLTDYELIITHPEGYELDPAFAGRGKVIYDQNEALKGADFVYGKNWSSYQQYGQILSVDSSWAITPDKMALTNNGRFMHCLPVRRGLKVADAVLDSPNSLVVPLAANREWSAHAVLKSILEGMGEGN